MVSVPLLPPIHPRYEYAQQWRSLPSFGETFGHDEKFPPPHHMLDRIPSQSSLHDSRRTSVDISRRQSPARSSISSTMSYTNYTSEGEYAPGDDCPGCHGFVPSYQPQTPRPNPMDSRNAITHQEINPNHRILAPAEPIQRVPWAVESIPFRSTTRPSPIPAARSHYSRRQGKVVKDAYQKDQTKIQHSDKEKWRRDKIAIYTDAIRIMIYALPWPGAMSVTPSSLGPCKVKNCCPPKALNPKHISKHRNGKKGTRPTGASHHARNNKEESSKSVVLFWDVLWIFSFAVHFQPATVPLSLEEMEDLTDESLDYKEKNMSQKTNERARGQGERDITGKTAYEVLEYMLEQCRAHGIALDEGIAGRQEGRRIRMGIEVVEEGDACRGQRGTPGSSRTFSEYEEEEGDDMERGGKRRCRTISEGSQSSFG